MCFLSRCMITATSMRTGAYDMEATSTHSTTFLSEAIYGDDLDIFSIKPLIEISRIHLLYTSLSSKAFYILHFSHFANFYRSYLIWRNSLPRFSHRLVNTF